MKQKIDTLTFSTSQTGKTEDEDCTKVGILVWVAAIVLQSRDLVIDSAKAEFKS